MMKTGQWVQIDSCNDKNAHKDLKGIIYSDRGDDVYWVLLLRSTQFVQTCICTECHEIEIPSEDVVHVAALIAYVQEYVQTK